MVAAAPSARDHDRPARGDRPPRSPKPVRCSSRRNWSGSARSTRRARRSGEAGCWSAPSPALPSDRDHAPPALAPGRCDRSTGPKTRPAAKTGSECRASPRSPRGIRASGYRERLWTMRQYAGYATAAASNRRYRRLLESGQTGLSVAFDLPTQIGYDSDHPLAAGEVGRVGVAIDSIEDMETLFSGIPLGRVSTSMTINATAAILLALYVEVARRQGTPLDRISGTVQNDILKEYAARGDLDLSRRAVPAPRHRCHRVVPPRVAAFPAGERQRLPPAGGRLHGGAGSGFHPGERPRLCPAGGRARPGGGRGGDAGLVLLQRAPGLPRGSRQVPRRPPPLGTAAAASASVPAVRGPRCCASMRRRRARP